MFYVYAWYEPDGTCFYVGKGTGDRYRRRDRRNAHWRAIAAQHNGNVSVRLLYTNLIELEAFELEIKAIAELAPRANMTKGGEGVTGYTHTQTALDRTGAAQRALWADPAYKAKMSEAHRGPLSEEHKALVGAAHRGLKRSAETCARISAAKQGKPCSEATKIKIRAALLRRSALCKGGKSTTSGNH